MAKNVKTNVMRLLDKAKIAYETKEYPVDENGFFYEKVDISDRMQYEDGSIETLVQTTYLEGRDKEGNVLYRDGIDDEGNRWIGDYDFGMREAD